MTEEKVAHLMAVRLLCKRAIKIMENNNAEEWQQELIPWIYNIGTQLFQDYTEKFQFIHGKASTIEEATQKLSITVLANPIMYCMEYYRRHLDEETKLADYMGSEFVETMLVIIESFTDQEFVSSYRKEIERFRKASQQQITTDLFYMLKNLDYWFEKGAPFSFDQELIDEKKGNIYATVGKMVRDKVPIEEIYKYPL